MPKVHFIDTNGGETAVEIVDDISVMRAALQNNIRGIDGDCGGECACGTCHVFVDDAWLPRLSAPQEMETDMLAFVDGVQPNSRLSCQIKMHGALDGLVVRLPDSQH